jgi:hypothetical protein
MATTLLERLIGNRDEALGQWDGDDAWTKTKAKIAELSELRAQHIASLPGAREEARIVAATQKSNAAAVLVGDSDSKAVRAAEREAHAAEARVTQLEADIEATQTAIQTLESRLLDLEREARNRHVEQVIRPWVDEHMTEFVPLMKKVAEINTRLSRGFQGHRSKLPDRHLLTAPRSVQAGEPVPRRKDARTAEFLVGGFSRGRGWRAVWYGVQPVDCKSARGRVRRVGAAHICGVNRTTTRRWVNSRIACEIASIVEPGGSCLLEKLAAIDIWNSRSVARAVANSDASSVNWTTPHRNSSSLRSTDMG